MVGYRQEVLAGFLSLEVEDTFAVCDNFCFLAVGCVESRFNIREWFPPEECGNFAGLAGWNEIQSQKWRCRDVQRLPAGVEIGLPAAANSEDGFGANDICCGSTDEQEMIG